MARVDSILQFPDERAIENGSGWRVHVSLFQQRHWCPRQHQTQSQLAPDYVELQHSAQNRRLVVEQCLFLNDRETDAPQTIAIVDPEDSTQNRSRVFAKSYVTNLDWQTSFS